MSTQPSTLLRVLHSSAESEDARDVIRGEASNEFVFAVVGHAGSGTSMIATALEARIVEESMGGEPFRVSIIKARGVIQAWTLKDEKHLPEFRPGAGAFTGNRRDPKPISGVFLRKA